MLGTRMPGSQSQNDHPLTEDRTSRLEKPGSADEMFEWACGLNPSPYKGHLRLTVSNDPEKDAERRARMAIDARLGIVKALDRV